MCKYERCQQKNIEMKTDTRRKMSIGKKKIGGNEKKN